MTDDDVLRAALDDAVADVEPTDRLAEIRVRTGRAAHRRRAWYAAGSASLVVAAAAVAVVAVGAVVPDPDPAADPAGSPATAPPPSATSPAPGVVPPATTPVYYVGPGNRLHRYFEPEADPLALLTGTPSDPDYATWWEPGSLRAWEVTPDEIVVTVDEVVTGAEDLAWQQVVYTLQAVTGTRLPVRFVNPAVPLGGVEQAGPLDLLAPVNLSDPAEGGAYAGAFTARGVATGLDGAVTCALRRSGTSGGTPAWTGTTVPGVATTSGDRVRPWSLRVDLDGLDPGTYVLACRAAEPAGASPSTDTRTITVKP